MKAGKKIRRMPLSERRTVVPCWPEDSIAASNTTGGRVGVAGGGGGRPATAFAYSLKGIAARSKLKQPSVWKALGPLAACPFRVCAYIVKHRRHDLIAAGLTVGQVDGTLAVLTRMAAGLDGEVVS